MGVLSQIKGTWDRPVAYLPKQLDKLAGMLTGSCCSCLTGSEATKLTLGQDLMVKVPHEVNTLLQGDPHKWLSTSWITQYQGLLCENPHVTTEPCQALKLATLLPVEGPHMIARKYASRPDLRDQPIPDPDLILYTNGTSLVKRGQQLLGYTVVMKETIIEASSLTSQWST